MSDCRLFFDRVCGQARSMHCAVGNTFNNLMRPARRKHAQFFYEDPNVRRAFLSCICWCTFCGSGRFVYADWTKGAGCRDEYGHMEQGMVPRQSLAWLLLWTGSIAEGGHGDSCDPEVEPRSCVPCRRFDQPERVRGALVTSVLACVSCASCSCFLVVWPGRLRLALCHFRSGASHVVFCRRTSAPCTSISSRAKGRHSVIRSHVMRRIGGDWHQGSESSRMPRYS